MQRVESKDDVKIGVKIYIQKQDWMCHKGDRLTNLSKNYDE